MDGLDRIFEAALRLDVVANLALSADEKPLADITGHSLYLLLSQIRQDLTDGLKEAKYRAECT